MEHYISIQEGRLNLENHIIFPTLALRFLNHETRFFLLDEVADNFQISLTFTIFKKALEMINEYKLVHMTL